VRPKIAFGGTGALKIEKATTQPSCFAERQARMFRKGGDQPPPHGRAPVDLALHELAEHEGPLRVADQHDPAAAVVLSQIGAPCLAHVAIAPIACLGRDAGRVLQGSDRVLPVDRRVDAAVA
jgi:hypothetical protein